MSEHPQPGEWWWFVFRLGEAKEKPGVPAFVMFSEGEECYYSVGADGQEHLALPKELTRPCTPEEQAKAEQQAAFLRPYLDRIAELERALSAQNEAVCQPLGLVLGYPRFCDDRTNFPTATRADGVCIGDHDAVTIAREAAEEMKKLRRCL